MCRRAEDTGKGGANLKDREPTEGEFKSWTLGYSGKTEMGGWALRLAVGICLLLLTLTSVHADEVNHCTAARTRTCSECVQVGAGCAYCPDETFEFDRCDLKENLEAHRCSQIISFESSRTIDENIQIDESLKQAQVAPQLMHMTLLPGEEKEVEMEVFEPARGPLDLYILMDFSNSMSDDLDNLKRMGDQLTRLVGDLSDDYTIGFGKFVDKVSEPQTDMRPAKLAEPWPNSDPPFSFRNVITLTNNINTFRQKLQKERISGNLDAPEGGFDAILQTAVCQQQIGWRQHSTHLLVFSTESAFHYEADGANVLAGILDRNDEQCHLTADGKYTHDVLQDYPSIPTLVRLLVKHNIIPVFAITNHSYSYYEKLHEYFPIAELGLLQEDSSNILNILEKAYENIRSKISIRAEERPKAIEAKILSRSGAFSELGNFQITPGKTGKFKVRLKALNQVGEEHVCKASQADRAGTLRVKPSTFSAAFRINAEVLCQTCSCENTPVKGAGRCNGHGDLGICNDRGVCKCGRCECEHSGLLLGSTCEANFQQQVGMCEGKRSCVQCQAWNTGEMKGRKCDECTFQIVMVEELKEDKNVIETCSFRDEDDDCTYQYTVNYPLNITDKEHFVLVKKKKDCPPAGFLWLIPLIMFLMLLLGLLLLCCWKYCACCKACLALLPCFVKGRMVGFKENQYLLRQSFLPSDYLDTPMVRSGPLKSTDIVRWKVTDNVHQDPNQPENKIKPNPKETIPFPVSLRLNRQYSETLSNQEARDTDLLRREVEDNLNDVFLQIPGAQRVQRTQFRTQRNSGKRQSHTVVDTVLAAPRSSFPDIVKLTDKQVQAGNFRDLKVIPGYYTVASDREAAGAVEFQEGVESVDVRVPLFIKDEDDDKKELLVQAVDVPFGIAKIGKDHVNITVLKEQASSIFTFMEPSYTYSRQDRVAIIPIKRQIIEDGRTQVTYSTQDLSAKNKKDYIAVDGDLSYGPGETEKMVTVKLLELGLGDGLLEDKPVKQFVMDLSNPRQGAKLGRYPRTVVTIADKPVPSAVEFKESSQTFRTTDQLYSIPVERTRNLESAATVYWRTDKATRFDDSGSLKFAPGETEKSITINPHKYASPIIPEKFCLELFDPSINTVLGEKKSTEVIVIDGRDLNIQNLEYVNQITTSPGGRLYSPSNIKAVATGPKNIRLNWNPCANALGYKVKYWIYGDPESEAKVLDVKTTQAEMTNLYPYCDYEMCVCGYNAIGDGNYSDIIQCQTLEDLPGEPGRLAFNVISPTVTQISWAEPAETNGVITSYEVIYTPIDENKKPLKPFKKVMINNPKKRMLLIENLEPSQTYCYKVRASNKVGWGPYRDATINLATQPTRPMSIPIIPEMAIVDAEAGEDFDIYLMRKNEVVRSPTISQRPSVTDLPEGSRWKHVQLVGSDLDLRKVSWKLPADIIPWSPPSDSSDNLEEPLAQDTFVNAKWDQSFLFTGGSSSAAHNVDSSSSTYSHSTPRPNVANYSSTSTSVSGKGASTTQTLDIREGGFQEEVMLRKRSENRHYTDGDGVRDSIVMGDLSSGFLDKLGVSSFSQTASSSYSLSSRSHTQTEDINDALLNLESVIKVAGMNFGVPETPSRLVFSALGPTSLKVSWQEPRCQSEVLGYCVIYKLINGDEVKRIEVSDSSLNSVVVQDLLPNQSYVFKVKAQSQEGWGPEREGVITIESTVDPKSPLSPVPGSPFTLSTPSAPGPLIFTALRPDTLQLSWDKPRKPNGDVLGYLVTCSQLHSGGDVRSFQVDGNAATSLTVSELKENTPYKFKVQAQTTQGFGPEREGIITIESQDEDGMMMMSSRKVTTTSSSITRQVEMVQRGGSTVTQRVERQYYEA
ncbi:hypothetical protein DNTS_024646 [Danionella cerebrum]|uniref:Integrin beta n=1 Tax=Danionella cerebrum TaxID=2873325 RepID=A0A553NHP5_9TELE|nr:hypothetical protein DNTS_024646 [Danionella translucida]